MAIFSLLECFATSHKLPILERSIAVRRACIIICSFHVIQNKIVLSVRDHIKVASTKKGVKESHFLVFGTCQILTFFQNL